MKNKDSMTRLPLSKAKKALEKHGVRVIKYRYDIPTMSFRDVLGFIEPQSLREQYLKFYNEHPLFAEMPAGAKHHHWWKGGLEDHVKEMIGMGFDLLEMYPGDLNGQITKTDIVVGCFLHDFAKVITYRYISKEEKAKTPGKFLQNQIFTMRKGPFNILDEETWTLLELARWGIIPTDRQWSAVLFAEGGWADGNWGPMRVTTTGENVMAHNSLAVIMHILDMYSSQVLGKSLVAKNSKEENNAPSVNKDNSPAAVPVLPGPAGGGVPPETGGVHPADSQLPEHAQDVQPSQHGGSDSPAPRQDQAAQEDNPPGI